MILGGRRNCGKTTELIKLASVKHLYIICANQQRARNITRLAKELELIIPYPITVNELPLISGYIKEVIIDDIEDVLSSLIQKPIKAMTTNLKMIEVKT